MVRWLLGAESRGVGRDRQGFLDVCFSPASMGEFQKGVWADWICDLSQPANAGICSAFTGLKSGIRPIVCLVEYRFTMSALREIAFPPPGYILFASSMHPAHSQQTYRGLSGSFARGFNTLGVVEGLALWYWRA
jgi:hypothetical protein